LKQGVDTTVGRLESAMHSGWTFPMAIIPGGLLIGALIGDAVDPRIKDPPQQWWQMVGADTSTNPNNQVFAEVGPYDLDVHSGYRPDLDYEAEVWSLPLPEYVYYVPTGYAAEPAVAEAGPPAAEAETAADEAAMVAEEAVEVADAQPAIVDMRQAELAENGIY
jgi:hypothetical protein